MYRHCHDLLFIGCLVGWYVWYWHVKYTIPHIVDFRSAWCYQTNTSRLQISTRAPRQCFWSRVFFFLWRLVRPSHHGERTVPLANMLFGAKNANIAQLMRRLDCRVHEETPRPLKLTHGRSIALWSKDQISATDFAILTLMTKYRCRTRWEHSKSELLLDDNARHDPRSPSVFGAQQHLCKRSSALAVLTRPD